MRESKERPFGDCTLRTLVGSSISALQPLNDVAAHVQPGALKAFGLADAASRARIEPEQR